MTINEALAVLEQHQITRGISDPTRLILHNDDFSICEQIGEIYATSNAIYIAEYIPSQVGMSYTDVKESLISLDSPRASMRLQTILEDLPTSARRYEEEQRKQRTRNVQQYFGKRNMKIEILPPDAPIPDPPDDWTLYIR